MHCSKKASTQGYSVVFLAAFIVIIVLLSINTFRWNNKFGNRAIGQEALTMVSVEQNAELARQYVEASANLALKKTVNQFTVGGGTLSSEGVYPILKDRPLPLIFLEVFKENFEDIMSQNPYQIPHDFQVYANFSNGTTILGIGEENYTFLKDTPIQALLWPVNSLKMGRRLLKDGCYGFYNNNFVKRILKRNGILVVSDSDKVYSVADNGEVVKASMLFQSNSPCMDTKTGVKNYDCLTAKDGNFVIVSYPNFDVKYARLKSINVLPGQKLKRGDLIGSYGNTGMPFGDALLLEIFSKDGKPINPLCFYSNVSFQNGKPLDCEPCNEKRYTTQILFKVHTSFNVSELQKFRNFLLEVKSKCIPNQSFSKCVEDQLFLLKNEGHDVKLMNDCEKGPYKSYYNFSSFIEDCVESSDTDCQCVYNLNNLANLYPEIFKNPEEYIISLQRTATGTRIVLYNATDHKQMAYSVIPKQMTIQYKNFEKPLSNLSIDFVSNPNAKFVFGILPHYTSKFVIVKNGTKIFITPYVRKDIKKRCSLNKDIVRFCVDGLKFEINKQYYTTRR